MKNFLLYSIVMLFALNNFYKADAQGLSQKIATIKDKIAEIQVDKITVRQTFELKDEAKGKILYTCTEVDDKGKSSSESYEFFLSDIDKNTIIRKPSGKKMQISISTVNNQKFIKHMKGDVLDSYESNFLMVTSNADQASEISNVLAESIPMAKNTGMDWPTAKDALNWLKSNIGQVVVQTNTFSQTLSFDNDKYYLVNFYSKKTDPKGATTEESYDFNIADINKNEVKVKISGLNISVVSVIKGKEKYIKYSKNTQAQGFESDFEIIASDIEQARNIINAMVTASIKSKVEFTQYSGATQALDFLKSSIKDIQIDAKSIKQKFDYKIQPLDLSVSFTNTETDSKGKSVENLYEFYPVDIDDNTIDLKVSGKKVTLTFVIKNKQKFIRYSKDNFIQSYEKDLDMIFDNIENARCSIDALKYVLKNVKSTPAAINSVGNAMDLLQTNLVAVQSGSDNYKQTFTGNTTAPYPCKYTQVKTDSKGATTEQSFEFYPYFLDNNTIKIGPSGKYLTVSVYIKNKKSFVKIYKNEVQQSYDNSVEFMTTDIRTAKDIADAIKYLAANAKPETRDWSDKTKTSSFLTTTVGNLAGKGVEVKQQLTTVDNDPCKCSLKISTSDDKGKTTEEIYEFNLSDMNKLAVDFKISGKNVNIILISKNKEKLIKYYKNGAQQSFASDLEIMEDDVDTAQNLADAFKAIIADCEKQ
jgi:hypothetical protein